MLFWFGSGPVRGFAVTMGLGIVISMFTAVSVVRVLMTLWVRRKRPARLVIRPLFGLPSSRMTPAQIHAGPLCRDRIVDRLVARLGRAVLQAGLNYGIDFVGGSVVEVGTTGPAELARCDAASAAWTSARLGSRNSGPPIRF